MTPLQESLAKCTVVGNTLYLPKEQIKNYIDVRRALIKAGGEYKKNSFVFPTDAQPYVDRLLSGQSVNIKKEFQFFPTPPDIAEWLVEIAFIEQHHQILEPSAGQGALIDAILKKLDIDLPVFFYELMPENHEVCEHISGTCSLGDNFLTKSDKLKNTFDRIVANPPFSKNQDIEHIRQMYKCLKPGGRLVSVASNHWKFSERRAETIFKNWLNDVSAEIFEIEPGRFKSGGTMIGCCVITIDKEI